MEDEYGMADLRPYSVGSSSRSFFPPAIPSAHRSLTTDNLPYYMLNFAAGNNNSSSFSGFETGEAAAVARRWPRQETLSLLEIRSRLDPRFKEANQKGPLWDEVSRIMSEEFGYQRNAKKCREKFENLYKYYKKNKAGRRQDGKHYRFFGQLEVLYGDTTQTNTNNNNNFPFEFPCNTNMDDESLLLPNINNNQDSYTTLISNISNSSDSDTLGEDTNFEMKNAKGKKKLEKRGLLEAKIKESMDTQMKEIMEKQEAWMEKMMRTIEENEQERISREEQRRRLDVQRIERERKMWAGEKAWIQARDAALMDAFRKMTGKRSSGGIEEQLMATFGDHMNGVHYSMKIDEESRKEGSGIGTYHRQNDGESMSEQGTDNGSSPPAYNALSDLGGFRYFGGNHGYGRI